MGLWGRCGYKKELGYLASWSNQATDTLRALARATTSKSNTGRVPCSILEILDWSTFNPNTCNLAGQDGHGEIIHNKHQVDMAVTFKPGSWSGIHLDHLPKGFHLKTVGGSLPIGERILLPLQENIAHCIWMNLNSYLLKEEVGDKGVRMSSVPPLQSYYSISYALGSLFGAGWMRW